MSAAYIDTFVRYSDRTADGGFIRANGDYSFGMEDHPARVHNARLEPIDFATHGFTLLKHATDVDFTNPEDVKSRWYPEACRLVKELTGAAEVFAFMGILRGGEEKLGGGPALSAHVDFNEPALRGWVQRLAPDRAAQLANKRLVNINLWRAYASGPVQAAGSVRRAQCREAAISCWCASAMGATTDGPVPGRPQPRLQPEAPLVLLPGHAAGRGHRLPAARYGRHGLAHDGAHGGRGSDGRARCAKAHELRVAHAGRS